jgi:hypothetical protein
MAKSVVWRSETHKFEFEKTQAGKVLMSLTPKGLTGPLNTVELTTDDMGGIADILMDYKYEIRRDLENKESEVDNG